MLKWNINKLNQKYTTKVIVNHDQVVFFLRIQSLSEIKKYEQIEYKNI